jgi:hypothetical protein
MKSTGNVGGGDKGQDRLIVSHFPYAKAFAHIAVQINLECHGVPDG